MSNFAGLFTKRFKKIGGIFIDVFIREVHKSSARITEFPLELGVNINDHRIIEPKIIEIEGIVSNSTSLTPGLGLQLPNFITGTNSTRATQIYTELLQLLQDGEPIDLVTGLITYKNMVLRNLEVDRDKLKSNVLFFNAKLQEVIIIQSGLGGLDPEQFSEGKTRDQASQQNNFGRQSAEPIDDTTTTRNINYIKNIRASA